jgi:glycosyltransferase involved in cell wall biosynthesis
MASGSDATPSVSVVIPTRGTRPDVLASAIERLSAEQCVRQVIVVGDSGIGRSFSGDRQVPVTLMDSPDRGPNASRQVGLDAASEDVVLFLDDDVLPDPGLAAGHAAHHARTGNLVVVGYMPVVPDAAGRHATATAELYALEYERRVGSYEGDPGSILRNLWGGNISLHRSDALRVGVDNAAHPGRRHEDQDFGFRCMAAGLHGVFDRNLRAGHHYRRSRSAFLSDAWAQGYERTLLRHNEPRAEWFVRGTARQEGRTPIVDGGLRSAELLSLKAARRVQFWRGARSAARQAKQREGHL